MGWIPDVVPDEPVESVWGNEIRDRTVHYFANVAERNAAVVAPHAGMFCYLTDPDVLVVYSGSAWLTITPVAAAVNANEGRGDTSYGDLATPGPAVTVETGTRALATATSNFYINSGGAQIGLVGIAVSGATTIPPTDVLVASLGSGAGWPIRAGGQQLITGLTPGQNTFTLKYRTNATAPVEFATRTLSVVGV